MEVLEALREGRALIEKGWTQGRAARDRLGNPCWVESGLAASYCTTGAASAVTWDCPEVLFSEVLDALTGALADLWEVELGSRPWDSVDALVKWNDSPGRSKNEVLRLWDRAIQLVSAAEEVPALI